VDAGLHPLKDVGQDPQFLSGVVDRRDDEELVEAGEERGVGQFPLLTTLVLLELLQHLEGKLEQEVLVRLGVEVEGSRDHDKLDGPSVHQ